MPFRNQRQYQQLAAPPPEVVTEDKWYQPWSVPNLGTKVKAGLAVALMVSGLSGPVAVITPNNPTSAGLTNTASSQVAFNKWIVYESDFTPVPIVVGETITVDKWNYAWSEPVRFRQLPAAQQHSRLQSQIPIEIVTEDKWHFPWTDPVRQKIGLGSGLQQASIGPVLQPSLIDIPESRIHQPWSEPVRTRWFAAAQQQAEVFPPPQPAVQQVVTTTLTSQVIFKGRLIYQGITKPVFVPTEVVTVDKWFESWTDPVRQKPGLSASLQQAFIGTVLNPETQITQNIESRWHYPWSEPVRFRQLSTAQQQSTIYQSAFFETINIDKWGYAWSEPVRQKPGLAAHLQQSFIATTLEPNTQIVQTYESRWHFAWSEPVRIRPQVPAGEQQTLIQGPVQTPEFITVDKWIYGWSEPVRQKIGLAARLQQAFIAPVLADEQVIGTIESRWHQPWSEPVRFRQFPVSEQQALIAPATSVFETVTVDKWVYQWSEPVRQKPGLKTYLQQALIATTLEPNTQIIQTFESCWHQPWLDPVRPKVSVANQPSFFAPVTVVSETVTVDKWYRAFNEPVRVAQRTVWYQPFATDTTAIPVGRLETWYAPLSEPSVKSRLRTSWYQSFTADTLVVPVSRIEPWIYPWSEPVRKKPGLGAWLQKAPALETPPFPTFLRTIPWYRPLNEPVRLKIGLQSRLQQFFTFDTLPPPLNVVTLVLSATETNSDSAFFGVTVYNQAAPVVLPVFNAVVSIKEIEVVRAAALSIEEEQARDNAAVSIEEV